MAGRDITIPFGPDKTGGLPLDALSEENTAEPPRDPFSEPSTGSLAYTLPDPAVSTSFEQGAGQPTGYSDDGFTNAPEARYADVPEVRYADAPEASYANAPAARYESSSEAGYANAHETDYVNAPAVDSARGSEKDPDYHPGGLSEEEATAQGMDEIQMSILALKDSIGQGRELKEREKDRAELAEALEADHIELADRENILNNYQAIVAEQDAIIADCSQRRDAAKAELSQLTIALEQTQGQLEAMREQQALQLQPLESDLGRARAAADQAKNDERSRKSELSAAESELRKADEAEANTMAVARHQQVKAAYDEARNRSEQAKEMLAQVQKAYDETKQRFEQAQGPLERNIEDMNRHIDSLKQNINNYSEELAAAQDRRQYCDNVYQYPGETAQMRSEIEQAEALARQMDAENDTLREQLAQSKKKAVKAKVAIGIVIALVILIIVAFVVVSGR